MNIILFHFLAQLALGKRAVQFAQGTKEALENDQQQQQQPQQNNEDCPPELSDAELRKIVAERPEDDPLNAFYDPFEPYRLSTYAYWHPITDPQKHTNPLLPSGFLPPFAPPKSLPNDFFHDNDEEARKLVLEEHAAAFCPFLRRWREEHPLKPYPIGPDFMKRHPPIKFVSGTGYKLDTELARLNSLFEELRAKRLKEMQTTRMSTKKDQVKSKDIDNDSESEKFSSLSDSSEASCSTDTDDALQEKALKRIKTAMAQVKRAHKSRGSKQCSKDSDFVSSSAISVDRLDSISCLEEAIFTADLEEDLIAPVERDESVAELNDKFEFFRELLLKHFGAEGKGKSQTRHLSRAENDSKRIKEARKEISYRGSVPDWARPEAGEELYSSDEEVDLPETYCFPYSPVPLPSIQSTLQKFVNI